MSKESKYNEKIGAIIGDRYKISRTVGAGTYGAVYECEDIITKKQVALKKLHRLEDRIDGKRVLREIRILRCCNHENILKLLDVVHVPDENGDLGDIFLITDLLETDLYSILKSKQPLTDEHAQYFVYQILRALKYLHSAGAVHRDIKPSNILVNGNCDISICDFGLARSMEDENQIDLTEYVVTRFYRAPEIMLCSQHYNKAVDIWSVGCTLGEILGRRVLFPGSNYVKQINYIIDALGTPEGEDMEFITNPHAKKYIQNMDPKPSKDFREFIAGEKEVNPLAIDLLQRMLAFNPQKRITVDEALKHPYIEAFHDPEDEPEADQWIDYNFEKDPKITYEQLKDLIRNELKLFPTSGKAK